MTDKGSSMLTVDAEVTRALANHKPVVALESTIIAHGFPYPANREVGAALELAVRDRGCVPATIALLDGKIRAGLSAAELDHIARRGPALAKTGATELAAFFSRGLSAATTVSATATIAHRAGIRVFATGGIGGVHRGDSADVSHDLIALSRTPIAVISAGAKAILDLPRTLEHLETLGVLVIGFATDEFPAFYSRQSGLRIHQRCDSVDELAAIATAHWSLGGTGILVCNPIPVEHEIPADELADAISAALAEATAGRVVGKDVTPFLLSRLAESTGGRAPRANHALAVNNAALGADLAIALSAIRRA